MRFHLFRTVSSLFIIASLLLLISCGNDDEGNADNFNRQALLENAGSNIILPAFTDFSEKTAVLKEAAYTLAGEVNQVNLTAAQEAWLDAKLSWKYSEMFEFGPVDQLVAAPMIDNWPTNTVGIEEALDTTTPINSEYIASLGSTRKGLPAVEYFLFDFSEGDQAILDKLQSHQNRLQYLTALTERLHTFAVEIHTAWDPSGGNYLDTFTNSTGKSAASSINILANNFLMLIEEVKNKKLGIPLGKSSMGTLLPENVEARFSGRSLVLIERNLDAIEDVFTGNGTKGDLEGYADYLNALGVQYQGQPLSEAIIQQIAVAREKTEIINEPLKVAVEANTAQVDEAYNAAQRLVVFTKTDMMSNLGLLVTYTDNDGD